MDYQKKITELDSDIVKAVDSNDLELATKKSKTKQSIKTLLAGREQAKTLHEEEKYKHLLANAVEDAVYAAAEKAGDNGTMEAIKNRKLTKQAYQELSIKYWVNLDSVEYDPENDERTILIQRQIMEKANKWTAHHRTWLKKKTDELVNNEDKAGLEQLNKWIDFDNGKLILNTKLGTLKFAPQQASYDDIKDIDWIKKDKNVWTENKETKKSWLRANFDAVKKMRAAGKKVCDKDQLLAAANVFPWWWDDVQNAVDRSTKVKDFFDLLWVNQYGFRNPTGGWNTLNRNLRSSSGSWDDAYRMGCNDSKGRFAQNNQDYGLGVWFLED